MAKELLLLVGSIVSSTAVSLFLSLSLFLRRLLRHRHDQQEGWEEEGSIRLYEGSVSHLRTLPVRHAFRYPVRYALLDLDLHPRLPRHLSASEARRLAAADGPVLLLTIPESVGYEQNPLSIYYCFHHGSLKACIAEVTNTPWGERVRFVFSPGTDLVAKPLHVSPFMDMMGNWKILTEEPGEKLSVVVSVHHPHLGNYFTATLKAQRVPCSSSSPTLVASFFWLMPHKVALWIYWHALKLWWKGISFVSHPKYLNPTYREDALRRDRELHHFDILCQNKADQQLQGEDYSAFMNNKNIEGRCCIWKDAPWPWS